ncbi:MAG: hypothetical protein HQL32_07945 [Planctomycetes bacterium]|nr:hypothetical protein [Planctomycetota bacterium]
MFNLRVGKFNTPLGLWTPAHWAILTETSRKPLHEADKLIPVKQVGMQYFSTTHGERWDLDYSLYISNGEEISDTNKLNDRAHGWGADIKYTWDSSLIFGASHLSTTHYNTMALYAHYSFLQDRMEAKAEYMDYNEDTILKGDRNPWYIMLKGEPIKGKWLGVRYDAYSDNDSSDEQVTTFFVNIFPISRVVIKAEYNMHDFSRQSSVDYNEWQLWLGVIL